MITFNTFINEVTEAPERVVATNKTIEKLVQEGIKKYGKNADLNYIDVSQVTNMESLFKNTNFNGDISKWDVSNVENMIGIFMDSDFNGDISGWKVSKVESIDGAFMKSKFNQDISEWDVSNLESATELFKLCPFNQPLAKWGNKLKRLRLAKSMFYGNEDFDQDISNWDLSKCKDEMGVNFNYGGNLKRSY